MEPVTTRRWSARASEPPLETLRSLQESFGLGPLTARVLALRGLVDPVATRQFLQSRLADLPDPFELADMQVAVERLSTAIRNNEQIVVHGDYDVDGISAATLVAENLRACGARCDYFLPLRLEDGYGLSAAAIERCVADGVSLMISVDCGVSAHAEADLARQRGLDLIITDHHQPPEQLPVATAVINPQRRDDRFPDKGLAGVGVAFMLLVALRRELRESGWFAAREEPDLRTGLDLVALGTIADIAPLQGLNRTLVKVGLGLLEQGARPGIAALKRVAGVTTMSPGVVAFQLAPRLNAAGRLEDAALGVELLLGHDPAELQDIAARLDDCNRQRRELERQTCDEAIAAAAAIDPSRRTLVLGREGWHPGVIGIVASRLVERYHRPTALLALEGESGKGSARSVPTFDLYAALCACQESLSAFGGHAQAAGLALDTARLPEFEQAFEQVAGQRLPADDLLPTLRHDGEVVLDELHESVVRELALLAPFGAANPEPVFMARAVSFQQLRILQEKHLKMVVRQGGYTLPGIAFGRAPEFDGGNGPFDILFTPEINVWRDRAEVQLRIRDLRTAV